MSIEGWSLRSCPEKTDQAINMYISIYIKAEMAQKYRQAFEIHYFFRLKIHFNSEFQEIYNCCC